MQVKTAKQLVFTISGSWGLLGGLRGMQEYDHFYVKETTYPNKPVYLYSTRVMKGIIGSIAYIAPMLLWITIPKEIYRLEVWIRELEEEKKSDYYNRLF